MGQNRQTGMVKPPENVLRTIIQGEDVQSAKLTVEWAEQLGRDLKNNGLKTSQIRNVFGEVRRIEMRWPADESDARDAQAARSAERDLLLLKPKLRYQAKREQERKASASGVDDLAQVLIRSIDLVDGDRNRFQKFVDFFEAILAYHKAEGGK